MVEIEAISDPGLGNTSYLVDLGDGSALVVDPERDPRPYLQAARRRKLVIRHVAETHLHADFVSGSRELVATGANLLASEQARLADEHHPVGDGDQVQVGDLTLQALASPGHTPEHVSYLISDDGTPLVLFSGGTLMVGGVARPDLIAPDLTVPLAHQAYQSVRRMLSLLPEAVEVRPTHGGGSFCSAPGTPAGGGSRIGRERMSHPVMTATDEDTFVHNLLAGLGSYPPYFRRLREVNQKGPPTYGEDLPALVRLSPAELGEHALVDVRPIARFAEGHIPGSVSIVLRPQFATWLGWLFDLDQDLVFVLDPDQPERELVRQALNIGYENLVGRIELDEWVETGEPLATIELVPPQAIAPDAPLLDVRQQAEWDMGHLPAARHLELGDLATSPDLAEAGMVVHCEHGQRAMTAASLLARAGKPAAVTTASQAQIRQAQTES